ncbi:hypothetical protein EXN66_Car018860 [Channa argus]|uniref:Ig-like domain-containing protein n=1 Tax=Channa argus TaxID=215402 RepID=A0A6G1QKU4_CHAAH|nr:hypothetical protein EXN66_Car018860 [Channa argus]
MERKTERRAMVQYKKTKWIKTSLSFILMLQLRVTEGQDSSFTVRVGDDITLPCENRVKDQDICSTSTWLVSKTRSSPVVELVSHGNVKIQPHRLSVTEKCSLVITKVTVEDVGQYSCRQYNDSGQQQGPDAVVNLLVINIYELKDDGDKVTLSCSVLTYESCRHTVQWLYQGNESNVTDLRSEQDKCSSAVIFSTSHLDQTAKFKESFRCNITDDNSGNQLLCGLTPNSSCEKPATLKKDATSITHRKHDRLTPKNGTLELWVYIVVAVAVAVLLLITVGVLAKLRTTKGNKKTEMENNTTQRLNPAVTQPEPESSQDTTDPEDDVAYVSISFIKSNSKVQDQSCDEACEGGAVTYSTVNLASSADASSDPSDLYATVNKSKKLKTEAPV